MGLAASLQLISRQPAGRFAEGVVPLLTDQRSVFVQFQSTGAQVITQAAADLIVGDVFRGGVMPMQGSGIEAA
ncbi:hypothetical protein D3C73_954310 [compost metagenome]